MPTTNPYNARYNNMVRQNSPTKKGGRRPKEFEDFNQTHLSEDERDKRDKRRQRNKEAAARCRQRRLDQMNVLQDEVDKLKSDNDRQEDLIRALRQQKNELEQLLRNHGCKIPEELLAPIVTTTTAAHFANPIAPRKRPAMPPQSQTAKVPKMEPLDPTLTQASLTQAGMSDVENLQRPTSLAFGGGGLGGLGGANSAGVPISTPSNGLTPGGDFATLLLNQQTGLTPVTNNGGLTALSFPITSLATPLDCHNEMVLKTL